jgi:hypothetical protein
MWTMAFHRILWGLLIGQTTFLGLLYIKGAPFHMDLVILPVMGLTIGLKIYSFRVLEPRADYCSTPVDSRTYALGGESNEDLRQVFLHPSIRDELLTVWVKDEAKPLLPQFLPWLNQQSQPAVYSAMYGLSPVETNYEPSYREDYSPPY